MASATTYELQTATIEAIAPGRVRFIEHQGQRVLFINYSHCDVAMLKAVAEEGHRVIAREEPNSVLTLNDVTGTTFDKESVAVLQAKVAANAPYVRRAGVIGINAVTCAAQTSGKKRVAVLDFDYGTVQSYVSEIYGANQDVGKGITDMLVEKLVKDGKYSVIERKALDKILAEQNFSNSDRANPATAAKIGQILGVDAIIMGSITKFGRDDKSKAIGGLGIGPRAFGIGGVKRSEAKAVCAISARLVDTNTGEILAAVTKP